MVAFEGTDGEMRTEHTHASQIGYSSKPERVLGVWLHPGPRIWYLDDRGLGWSVGPRHCIRWAAGLGCTGHGTVLASSGQTWASRRAAVAWVVANSGGGR